MLSIPPATIISWAPDKILSWANIAAFIPEPHILFMVVAPTAFGIPAPIEACRAGACPWPAGNTTPIITSLTSVILIPDFVIASEIATAPSSGADNEERSPPKPPKGVLDAPTITTGSSIIV